MERETGIHSRHSRHHREDATEKSLRESEERFRAYFQENKSVMLLVDTEGGGRMERWLDSHPTLDERVQRVYGRRMQPIQVAPVTAPPEPAWRPQSGGQPAGVTIASLVDPFARHM